MLGFGCIDEFAIDEYSPPATVIIAFTAAIIEIVAPALTPVVGAVTPPPDAVIAFASDATASAGPLIDFTAAGIDFVPAAMSASAGASVGGEPPVIAFEPASLYALAGALVPIDAQFAISSEIVPLTGIILPIAAELRFLSDATVSAGAVVSLDARSIVFTSTMAPATGPYVRFTAPILGFEPAALSPVVGVVVEFITVTTIVTPPTLDEDAIDAPYGTRPVRIPLSMSFGASLAAFAGAAIEIDAPALELDPQTPAISARLKWPTMQFTFFSEDSTP